MKFLLIASNRDPASKNIAKCIREEFGVDVFEVEKELLSITSDDLEKAHYYIFLSKHRSKAGKPSLTVHTPGNLTENNEFGGNPKEVCPSDAILNTLLLKNIYNTYMEFHELGKIGNFDVSFEVVHHSPTDLKSPTVFVEIGSTEKEWCLKEAGEIIAKSVLDTIEMIKSKNYDRKIKAVGFGGGHYAPKFTKLALSGDYYFSYLVPKYCSVDEDVLNQLFKKTDVDIALIDWKGCKGEDKKRYVKFFEKEGIKWEKI
ncbi:MAG: D-aminoacyl-tRNA deacylase [Methanococci archaeon]|nr:D-aminoacyl-tRNA deacylase [Methanococci archaeon]